jgi:hypothetical protein
MYMMLILTQFFFKIIYFKWTIEIRPTNYIKIKIKSLDFEFWID